MSAIWLSPRICMTASMEFKDQGLDLYQFPALLGRNASYLLSG
jgi:hypothetical protein